MPHVQVAAIAQTSLIAPGATLREQVTYPDSHAADVSCARLAWLLTAVHLQHLLERVHGSWDAPFDWAGECSLLQVQYKFTLSGTTCLYAYFLTCLHCLHASSRPKSFETALSRYQLGNSRPLQQISHTLACTCTEFAANCPLHHLTLLQMYRHAFSWRGSAPAICKGTAQMSCFRHY